MNVTDKNILDELKKNGRETNKKIANTLKLSEGTIRNRIKKLTNAGVIKRFTVDLNTNRGFMAFVLIECNPSNPTADVVKKLIKKNDIASIFETTGRWDIILKVDTDSAASFNEIIESVRLIDGVEDTETITVLKIN